MAQGGQNKTRYKAGAAAKPAAAGPPKRAARPRHGQNGKWVALLALALAGLLALSGLLVWQEGQAQGALPPAAPALVSLPLPALPPPPAVSAGEAAAEAALPVLEAPAGGWEEYAFSEAETVALNTMLDEWAAAGQEAPAEPPAEGQAGEEPAGGHRVAVYFKDLDSGAEYVYNGEEKFDVASLSKAPYAMYLYQLVEQGAASLDETFLIDAESIKGSEENSGRLKDDPNLPRELTLAEMIEYLLRYSDTVAQRVLLKRYPADGYAAWAAGLGLRYPGDVRGVTSGVITAPDAGVYLAALQSYMAGGLYGAELQTHLMSTRNPMIRTPWPLARKYGWDEAAYHDMAVVYAPHPYLIAILTDKSEAAAADLAYFTTIPAALEQTMARHWAEADLGPNTKQGE